MNAVAAPKNIKEIAKGRSDLYRVSPYDLHVREGWNSRDDKDPENIAHVERLAKSIAEVGVKESLTVKYEDGKLWLTDGHCRRAASLLAIDKYGAPKDLLIPVKTEGRDASEADMVFSQIVRNSGKPLTPFEQGRVFVRLSELGWERDQIALKAGLSRKHVDNLITLHQAPEPVKEAVAKGEVAATLVTQVINQNRGDVEAAASDISAAIEKAKSEGKGRATAKDLPLKRAAPAKKGKGGKKVKAKPVDPKRIVRELKAMISSAQIEVGGEGEESHVTVTFDFEEWMRVKEVLAIKVAAKDAQKSRNNRDVL